MASNHAYQYSVVDIKFVMDEIDEFIIPENQEACKLLWSKNIFTVMCNNYENDDSWITIDTLSLENQKLFDELALLNPELGPTWGGIGFRIPIKPGKGTDTFSEFKKLIDLFPMQDVQRDGYMEKETFLTDYCDCFKMVPNPVRKNILKPDVSLYDDMTKYARDFMAYVDDVNLPSQIRVFDESKMTKTFEEYLKESKFSGLYDESLERVYYNQMYYDAHLRYIKLNKDLALS